MSRTALVAVAAVLAGGAVAAAGLFAGRSPVPTPSLKPVWTETAWPFANDPWGKGKAFHCSAADCGAEVKVYVRAKLGFCDCTAGIADDDALDRMGDLDLIGKVSALRQGHAISVASMKGRSRVYAISEPNAAGKTVLSVAYNERCDMVVATAPIASNDPAKHEPAVLDLLNSPVVMRWAEVTLGL